MIPDLVLAVIAGASGGLVAAVTHRLGTRHGRTSPPTLVDAPPGTVIVDDTGRRWTVNQRRIDAPNGGPYRLSVDLIERAAP